MQPFVTIAIPFYNSEEFLLDSIRSVYAQTYKNWELILIDDGSQDNSLEIANSIKDERVRVVSDGTNKKLASRLNEVTRLAKYDYLVRMDADDLIAPDRIETQMNLLFANKDLDAVTTGVVSITDNLSYVGHRGQSFNKVSLQELLNKTKGITHAALIAKKDWHKRNPYNENLKVAQDYSLWVNAAAKNDLKIQSISDPLYYYREEGNVKPKKMLLAYKYERVLYRKLGGKDKYPLLVNSYLKSTVVRVLSFFGKMDVLLKKRGVRGNHDAVIEKLKSDIETIRKTHVPGID
jgi:glycosyltransferase involved in cell wall biosynthesis